ncbi:MAG: protein translocase subunit SecF [Holosporales bacterium]|jgi:preprotein translocase SecF subunit|nr:protein translocase subunit SecF [Holosporales bacterium]
MFRLHLIPYGTKIDIVAKSKYLLSLALVIVVVCLSFITFKGLNYGIDFKGGYIFEVEMLNEPNIPDLRKKLENIGLGEVAIQQFGGPKDLMIKLEKPEEGENQTTAIKKIKDTLGAEVQYKRVETVGPKVGSELVSNAIKAVSFAIIAMLIYIAIRFEWQFGICAIAALLHDCAIIFGMFSIFPMEFSETSITAVLLTASYSINDTVVIFDRIRENLRRYKKLQLSDLINLSLNETLSRTTLTATTTLLAVLALYIFGGKVIASFAFPIIVGIIVGTFSSIFVASPLLVFLRLNRDKFNQNKKDEKVTANIG